MASSDEPLAYAARVPGAVRPRRQRRRRGGPRWLDFSIAATALVVSTASLLVARHQAQVMDRQLAASVWPQLEYSFSNLDENGRQTLVSFSLQNTGVGPLRLRSLRLDYDGRAVRNAGDLLEACCLGGVDTARMARDPVPIRRSYVASRVLGAGVKVDFFRFDYNDRWAALFAAVDRAAPRVYARACYCSVLNECWLRDSRVPEPSPVRSCDDERKQPQYN